MKLHPWQPKPWGGVEGHRYRFAQRARDELRALDVIDADLVIDGEAAASLVITDQGTGMIWTPDEATSAPVLEWWVGDLGVTLDGSNNVETWAGREGLYTMTTPGATGPSIAAEGTHGNALGLDGAAGTTQKRLDMGGIASTSGSYTFVFGLNVLNVTSAGGDTLFATVNGYLGLMSGNANGKVGFEYGAGPTSREIADSATGEQSLIFELDGVGGTGKVYRNGVLLGSAVYAAQNIGQAPDTRTFLGMYLDLNHAPVRVWKVAVFNGVLNAADRASAHKWAMNP